MPFGGQKKPESVPSTPEEAHHPSRVTRHDDGESVPSTPEDAKIIDYQKLRGKKRILEENGRYYFYDITGRKYECDEEGNKMWTSKRRPPQYDAYIWNKLGEDGRRGILEHFHNSPKKNGMVTSDGNVVDEIDTSEAVFEAENQSGYLSYKKNEFLHFHGDSGPIQIP